MKRAVCMIRNLLFDLVVFGRLAVDMTATSVKFEIPLVDVLEASHRSSGLVTSSVELFGAWVDCAREPNCGTTQVDFTP